MIFTLNTISKIFALASFILSTLCLFAGSEKSVLQNASVMLLDTSASQPTAAIQSVVHSTTADLGLKDFYAIHVLTYCEGNFKSANDGGLNVTSCSKRKAPFAFDPTAVFSATLKAGFNISDINWPETITDDFEVMELTTRAMSVLYVVGAASTGVAFLMEILLAQAGGKPSMFAHLFFAVLSFVCLGVSSSVASVIAIQFVDLINRHGQDYGIVARGGTTFLGMTWSAVILSFLAIVMSVITLPASGGSAVSEKEIEEV